jgi:heterodisulfide reductase subunit A-like polyferredoxin
LCTAELPTPREIAKDEKSSFLADQRPIKRFPHLQSHMNVDALVIGAGITGITSAYLLKKARFAT